MFFFLQDRIRKEIVEVEIDEDGGGVCGGGSRARNTMIRAPRQIGLIPCNIEDFALQTQHGLEERFPAMLLRQNTW